MKWLPVKGGARVQVDDDVFEWAKDHKWFMRAAYAARYIRSTRHGAKDRREAYLHREVMDDPANRDVHHVISRNYSR